MNPTRLFFTIFLAAAGIACGTGEEDCIAGEAQCNGDVLEECGSEGWEVLQDCAADEMVCHEEMGHCMAMQETGMDM